MSYHSTWKNKHADYFLAEHHGHDHSHGHGHDHGDAHSHSHEHSHDHGEAAVVNLEPVRNTTSNKANVSAAEEKHMHSPTVS